MDKSAKKTSGKQRVEKRKPGVNKAKRSMTEQDKKSTRKKGILCAITEKRRVNKSKKKVRATE